MESIISSDTHKGATTSTPTINSAHMEAVQKLMEIKYREAKKWTIVEVDSVIKGRNKPKPNNFTLDWIVSSIIDSILKHDART